MKKLSLLVTGLISLGAFWQLSMTDVSAAPLSCNGKAFMVRSETVGASNYSQLYEFINNGSAVDLSTMHNAPTGLTDGGTPINDTAAFPNGYVLNALAYNPADAYMYAARNADNNSPVSSNGIYRINADGALDLVFTANFTINTNLKGGAFSPDGTFYGIGAGAGGNTKLMVITGLDAAPGTPATMTEVDMSQPVNMGDVVFDFTNDTLYAVSNVTNQLYSINVTTGAVTTISDGTANGAGVSIGSNGIGSLYMTAVGDLMGYINGNATDTEGQLVSINKTNGSLTLVKVGPVTNNSDATACVPVDFSIDTVKSAGSVTMQSDTEYTVPYTVKIGNNGTVADPNVQAVDDLRRTFQSGTPAITVSDLALTSGPCTINSGYNGTTNDGFLTGTDTLNPGESCVLTFNVHLTYGSASSVPVGQQQLNTVYASTTATGPNEGHTFSGNDVNPPFNLLGEDESTDANDLPSSPQGDNPTPTPVVLSPVMIDVVKAAGTVNTIDETHYNVPYTLQVGNTGSIDAPNVQVVDNLRITFADGTPSIAVSDTKVSSGACIVNAGFNGVADIKLLAGSDTLTPGESCTITFMVALTYSSRSSVPTDRQNNLALASSVVSGPNPGHTYDGTNSIVPSGVLSVDSSTDGPSLPSNPHGDTSTPTPVTLSVPELAETGISVITVGGLAIAIIALATGTWYVRSTKATKLYRW